MLFSNATVAQFINANFEPAWESVRPVPIVRIDFGNGTVLTRTLHGNIASYVCFVDGQVADILPGIYEPATYREELSRARNLVANVRNSTAEGRTQLLAEYHQAKAENLKKGVKNAHILEVMVRIEAVHKARIERPLEAVIAARRVAEVQQAAQVQNVLPAEDQASWKELAEDTRLNEVARRQLIHEKLATAGSVKPEAMRKWLYKEVLHADLDDPYLGLGKTLFASYPFANEDK